MDKKLYKRCLRCKAKLMVSASKCPMCGFNYAKLPKATNAGAKEQIKAGHKENVIYVTERPEDIRKKNFLLLFWLFGWLGVYNIFIGKYARGISHLVSFLACFGTFLIYYLTPTMDWFYYVLVAPLTTVYSVFLIWYFVDICNLAFKKFKYPVSIPLTKTIDDVIKENDK